MNEKVKLPKFVCDWLKGFEKNYPLNVITKVNLLRKSEYNEVSYWLSADVDNQWKLIDALRYGYEAEPEPQWGIKVGNYYVHRCEYELIKLTKSLSLARVYTKESTEQMVKALGFGEAVDLNEEVDADDSTE